MSQLEDQMAGGGRLKLTANIIVRDELARYQPLLCQHLLSYCDEIRVFDDCSKDETGAACDALDPRVHVKRAMGSSVWDIWGEGIARQQALDWALEGKPTHILAIDADEFIPRGVQLRKKIRSNPDAEVFTLKMIEIWQVGDVPWKQRVDGQWGTSLTSCLWRVPPSVAETRELPDGWKIPTRRLASGREPEMVSLLAEFGDAVRTDIDICHLGWADPTTRRKRYERYVELDGGRFHDSAHLASIIEPPELIDYPAYPEVLPESSSITRKVDLYPS